MLQATVKCSQCQSAGLTTRRIRAVSSLDLSPVECAQAGSTSSPTRSQACPRSSCPEGHPQPARDDRVAAAASPSLRVPVRASVCDRDRDHHHHHHATGVFLPGPPRHPTISTHGRGERQGRLRVRLSLC
eukprot:1356511-Rhodomonas_salina.1